MPRPPVGLACCAALALRGLPVRPRGGSLSRRSGQGQSSWQGYALPKRPSYLKVVGKVVGKFNRHADKQKWVTTKLL